MYLFYIMNVYKFYPDFYKLNGKINTENLLKRKEIFTNYYKKFNQNKINLFIIDIQLYNEIKQNINGKCFKITNGYVFYKDSDIAKKFITAFNKFFKATNNIFIKDGNLNVNNKKLVYFILFYLLFGIKNFKKLVINMIVRCQKLSHSIDKELLNKSKNKDNEISYQKYYTLKYNHIFKNKKKINKQLSEYLTYLEQIYESKMN